MKKCFDVEDIFHVFYFVKYNVIFIQIKRLFYLTDPNIGNIMTI